MRVFTPINDPRAIRLSVRPDHFIKIPRSVRKFSVDTEREGGHVFRLSLAIDVDQVPKLSGFAIATNQHYKAAFGGRKILWLFSVLLRKASRPLATAPLQKFGVDFILLFPLPPAPDYQVREFLVREAAKIPFEFQRDEIARTLA
jgi:hypothetical protein